MFVTYFIEYCAIVLGFCKTLEASRIQDVKLLAIIGGAFKAMSNFNKIAEEQINNPLHGMTLEKIVLSLQDYYGWDGLAEQIAVRCFTHNPSIKSSLKFLRKTPWAREKLEDLFVYTLENYGEQDEEKSKV